MRTIIILFSLALVSHVTSYETLGLDSSNFHSKTSVKTVFIKFFAPWCAYCKQLAPAWEKLAEEWHRNEVGLVAEVDCTSRNGKLLCEQLDIRSFPTLMYGDPGHLEEYNGGRKYEDLAEFAEENLVPLCSPTKLDLCDEDTRKQIEEYLAMSQEELSALVESEEKKLANAKKAYDEEINALQQKYEEAAKTRDEAYASVREGGMSLMKAVEKVLKLRPTPTKSIQASTDEL